ncbi:hypothetical protein R6Y94_17310 [Plantactinospora sp. KLBMP9567]|nr:hypothetical protein [Plantactinospora sp. KLBMP9567]
MSEVLALVERGESMRRVSYDAYVFAVATTLARRHRPVWSWRR